MYRVFFLLYFLSDPDNMENDCSMAALLCFYSSSDLSGVW